MHQRKRPAVGRWLQLSLSMGLLTALGFSVLTIDGRTWQILRGFQPLYLLMAAALLLSVWLLQALLLQQIVRVVGHRPCLQELDALRVYLATFFMGGITPLASGEFPAACYLLSRHRLTVGQAGAIAFLRAAIFRLLFTVTGLAALVFYPGITAHPVIAGSFGIALTISGVTSAVYLLLIFFPGVPDKLCCRLAGSRLAYSLGRRQQLRAVGRRLEQEIIYFCHGANQLRHQAARLVPLLIISGLAWLALFSIAPVLLLGMGIPFHYPTVLLWQAIMQIIISYIPVPGGSGVAELGTAALFTGLVPPYALGVLILAWRFFTYYLPVLTGGIVAMSVFTPN